MPAGVHSSSLARGARLPAHGPFPDPHIISILLAAILGLSAPSPARASSPSRAPTASLAADDALYRDIGLDGKLDTAAFNTAVRSAEQHGVRANVIAIADLTQPSTAKRLFVIDLIARRLVLQTYVAHGQNTGDLTATRFSNQPDSHQTSLGLYRVGATIASPKHGAALLLEGLDRTLNGMARARELIIHGAAYASEAFIATHGRLGRSWGCPAVPREVMPQVIGSLAGGGLLYVYGG